jgi:undecaprenyl-diphosphatase
MAGLGLDAAMIEAAPEGLKRRAGWAAYAVAAARHLADRVAVLDLEVDGRRTRHRGVSMLLVGNIGRLQAGLRPMPDAAVDDGRLDLVVLAPRGRLGWVKAAAGLWRPGLRGDAEQIATERGRRVVARTSRPVAREADGESLPPASGMRVEIWPGAVTVRVPAEAAGRPS